MPLTERPVAAQSPDAEREALRRAWQERNAETRHLFNDPLVRKKIAEMIVRAA